MFARPLRSKTIMLALACCGCAAHTIEPPREQAIGQPGSVVELEQASPAPVATIESHATLLPLHAGRILLFSEAKPEWATGPVRDVERDTYHEKWQFERAARLDALPLALQTYAGMRVDLYGAEGRLCTVMLDQLTIEAHLAMDDAGGHKADPGDQALWEIIASDESTEQVVLLVASFADAPSCAGALWARDASLPAPTVLVPGNEHDHASLLSKEHRRALESEAGQVWERDFKSYAANPEYAEDVEDAGSWAGVSKGRRQVWIDDQGSVRVLSLDFGEHMFAPCRWQGPVHGVVRRLASTLDDEDELYEQARGLPAPVAVVDADLDGRYELLIHEDGGEFTIIHVISSTAGLQLRLILPDNSHVWC